MNAQRDIRHKDGTWRFVQNPDNAGDEGPPKLSYKMMGFIGERSSLTPSLIEYTQKTLMFDPFYEKALKQRAGILGDINISRIYVLYNETNADGGDIFSVITLPA